VSPTSFVVFRFGPGEPIQRGDRNDSRSRGLIGGEPHACHGSLQSGTIIVGEIRKASIYLIVTFLDPATEGIVDVNCRAVVRDNYVVAAT
jgi:hypothetical protein